MPIRPVSEVDIGWIVEELKELPKQSAIFADVPPDDVWVGGYFLNMLSQKSLVGSVCTKSSSFILGAAFRPWYASRLEVHEMILWVPQEHRGSRTAIRLIEHWTKQALDLQPHSIHAGASLDITPSDKTLRLYELCGYARHGTGVIIRT